MRQNTGRSMRLQIGRINGGFKNRLVSGDPAGIRPFRETGYYVPTCLLRAEEMTTLNCAENFAP
jgi:hypothetical protein